MFYNIAYNGNDNYNDDIDNIDIENDNAIGRDDDSDNEIIMERLPSKCSTVVPLRGTKAKREAQRRRKRKRNGERKEENRKRRGGKEEKGEREGKKE